MKVFDFAQGSDEWYAARRGIPTCSVFDKIITPSKGEPSSSQEGLINQLIADALCPTYGGSSYQSAEMQIGVQLEAEARRFYECMIAPTPVREVGFVLSDCGQFGGSPDALVGEDGGLELKCPAAATQVAYLRAGKLPNKYKCQVHGYLAVTGRKFWTFLSYYPGLPTFTVTVKPDEFTLKLTAELNRFCARLEEARSRFSLPKLTSGTATAATI